MAVLAAPSAAGAPQGPALVSGKPPSRPVPSEAPDGADDPVDAQGASGVAVAVSAAALPPIDGPAPPFAPAVINRDERGRATIRAVRLERPMRVDGRLDEEFYGIVPPITDFIQQIPNEGAPSTEPTEVWVFYDDENLYIAVRCSDSHPERIVANERRRDNGAIFAGGDNFTIVLDTFYDRRNGFFFQTNPVGAIRDQAVVSGQQLESWNTVWDVKADRFANGWAAEIVIPFKSVRYRRSGPQIWGINLRRIIKWKNEFATLTPVSASFGTGAMYQLGLAATLVGLETPAQSMNLEMKPYGLSSVTTDRTAPAPSRNDVTSTAGFDFKYGLTRSLIADVTVNTDFAQVEEDLQQVNLTRFSLFFPEKRDFFLEGQGIFGFGSRRLDNDAGAQDVPILFFSRRIGLSNGQSVPIIAGARLTGKAGPFDVGLLNIQTADDLSAGATATNFSAMRIKRDVLRRSSIGIIATERLASAGGGDSNLALGADASLRVSDDVTVHGYYARTSTAERDGDGASYRGRFDYAADRYGVALEHLMVGDLFNPALGFVRRDGFRRSTATARFSPRLRQSRYIRKLTGQGTVDYVTADHAATVENRSVDGSFGIEFHNGDQAALRYGREYELLPSGFAVAPGVTVPAGGYVSHDLGASYSRAQQRKLSGQLSVSGGTFYEGTKYTATYSGRLGLVPRFSVEPAVSLNWVTLPYADFRAQVFSARLSITPTTRLAVSSLLQFIGTAHTLSSSLRLRWEYIPGSELFVVYSDGRDTSRARPELVNRALAVKVTRLVRF
ncbi:MAG: hypothetical protein HY527_15620 [Betaproteobacteria bacterium]|nr:hypothetical protein [Betaproteobacteria bacterium]